MTTQAENIVTLFKNSNGNCNVVLHRTNQIVSFIDGKFFTSDKKLQSLLQEHADAGEMGIFVDRNEATIDTEAATPMAQLEKKIRAQLMEDLRSGKLKPPSSYSQDANAARAAIGGTDVIVGAAEHTQESQQMKDESVSSTAAITPPSNPLKEPEGLSALERLEWLKHNKPS